MNEQRKAVYEAILDQRPEWAPGPCARRKVWCEILTRKGMTFYGENICETPQTMCPRVPGEGYEKCKSICHQKGHAEVAAIAAAHEAGADLALSTATLYGHYWMCEPCGRALAESGVHSIRIILGL